MTATKKWIAARLGEKCSIEIGGTPSRNVADYWDEAKDTSNVWVSIRDLNRRVITETAEHISVFGIKHSNVKLQPTGTVLLSFKLTIGRVALAGCPLYTNEAIAGLRSSEIIHDYLYYGLQQWDLLQGVDQAIKGATLNKEKLKAIEICFPQSTHEQSKVTEVLSSLDEAIEQTEALVAKQQRVRSGLMQDLLAFGIDGQGGIRSEQTHQFKDSLVGRVPVEWDVAPLGQIAEVIDPNPSHRYPPFSDAGVPIVSTENFSGNNGFDLTDCDYVPQAIFKRQDQRCKFSSTDVVFARKGRLGFARPYGQDKKVFSHTIVIIKTKSEATVTNDFLLLALRNPDFFSQINERMNSNSGVPTLGVEFLKAIPIRVPKPPEQLHQTRVISQSEDAIEIQNQSLRKLRALKAGLMRDLLTGNKPVTALLDVKHEREALYA